MTERDWTDDAELLARAMDAGEDSRRSGWQVPDGNDVTIDGTYDATAVLNVIRAAAWDEGFRHGAVSVEDITRDDEWLEWNPYRPKS